eukprot:4922040-Pyramimonas_sp.AAC.1
MASLKCSPRWIAPGSSASRRRLRHQPSPVARSAGAVRGREEQARRRARCDNLLEVLGDIGVCDMTKTIGDCGASEEVRWSNLFSKLLKHASDSSAPKQIAAQENSAIQSSKARLQAK